MTKQVQIPLIFNINVGGPGVTTLDLITTMIPPEELPEVLRLFQNPDIQLTLAALLVKVVSDTQSGGMQAAIEALGQHLQNLTPEDDLLTIRERALGKLNQN